MKEAEAGRGVVTHSSGNTPRRSRLAAKLRGIPRMFVMPENSLPVKLRAVGATRTRLSVRRARRPEALAAKWPPDRRYAIPPFDHPTVIAGQGTIAVELVEQVENLDAIVAPVGGGGLISASRWPRASSFRRSAYRRRAGRSRDAARSKRRSLHPPARPANNRDGLRTSL